MSSIIVSNKTKNKLEPPGTKWSETKLAPQRMMALVEAVVLKQKGLQFTTSCQQNRSVEYAVNYKHIFSLIFHKLHQYIR